jgi:streptogramin lyase
MLLDIRTGKMLELNTGSTLHSAARGGFDLSDNAWFGGRDGVFAEIVNEIDKGRGAYIRTFRPPTPYFPYTDFYDAVPDKNGDVWGGILHGRGYVRFNPRTGQWVVYDNPEPSALDRRTFIDQTLSRPIVWYVDFHTGCIVRIQPLE